MDITVTSNYDRKTATVRPERGTAKNGKAYLYISDAQIAKATVRANVTGGDYLTLPEIDGHTEWQKVEGGRACYAL